MCRGILVGLGAVAAGFFLPGCVTVLEWKTAGVYGPRPTTREIFAICKDVLEDNRFTVTVKPKEWYMETDFREHASPSEGFQEQLRIKLVPHGKMTDIHIIAVKNENLSRFDPLRPHSHAYGPNENNPWRERWLKITINNRIKEFLDRP
jgi:hypothetical protein